MTQRMGKSGNQEGKEEEQQVVDFNQARTQKMEEKRRNTQRIFFQHLLNVYTTAGDKTLRPLEFIDVSEEGCSFQVPYDPDKPWPTNLNEMPIRVYFSQDTYLEIRVTIQNSRPSIENNRRYVRFGCTVDKTTASYTAYEQFVKFLKLYSEHAHKDMGDVSVFYL